MWLSRRLFRLSVDLAEKLTLYSHYPPTTFTLEKLSIMGGKKEIVPSTQYLRLELSVRVANILQEFYQAPARLMQTPSAKIVSDLYEQTFVELVEMIGVGENENDCLAYLDSLNDLYNRHNNVVESMACGVMEMDEDYRSNSTKMWRIKYFLDRIFTMRIAIRMIISHHLLVFSEDIKVPLRYIGCIDQHCDVVKVCKDAYADAKDLCMHYYGESPGIKFHLFNDVDGVIELVYVPSHLYHIVFEILKNAMRAVTEKCQAEKNDNLPPVDVLIISGPTNLTIRVSDKGGGFSSTVWNRLFDYAYTTANAKSSDAYPDSSMPPIAGYGFGLPLSRLYARYLNGDLRVEGIEGYGTDAYVYLMRRNAKEVIPVYNLTVEKKYLNTSNPVSDWTSKRSHH